METVISQRFNEELYTRKCIVFFLSISSLFIAFPAFYYPLIKIAKLTRNEQANSIDVVLRLFDSTGLFAIITLFSVLLAPLLMALCSIAFCFLEENECYIYKQIYFFSKKWLLLDIFAISIFASMIKLGELVNVQIGIGTYFCIILWMLISWSDKYLWVHRDEKKKSNLKALAFTISALFLLIPSNILPIMTTTQFGVVERTNLWESIMHLFEGPTWPIGIIVLLASFFGPWLKIFSTLYLILTKTTKKNRSIKRTLHYFFNSIGRWSMIDIFIAGILVSIVKLNVLGNISLEIGSLIFTTMVIFTLLASSNINLKEPIENEYI